MTSDDRQAAVAAALSLAFSILVGACSSDKASHAGPVVPSDAESVVVTSKGGMFALKREPDSNCRPQDSTFTLMIRTRELTWKTCRMTVLDGGAIALARFAEGEKTLTDAEFAPLDEALRMIKLVSREHCASDVPTVGITVTSPGGSTSYSTGQCPTNTKEEPEGLHLVLWQFDRLTGSESYSYSWVGLEDPNGAGH